MADPLPIDDALPDLISALRNRGRAVLQAPPGAGKTTRVPLAMLDAKLVTGRILMLEPRRLATRTAAERMAGTLGEAVGQTVGYRIRGEAVTSAATCIEVVTEGILTRMLQNDPGLDGVGAVIFDEFHERSLNADLGLALTLEVAGALREDLLVLVMSATLDAEPVAALMGDVPVITSRGQSFPVETVWANDASPDLRALPPRMADTIWRALAETDGGVLAFLPGEGEIRRVTGLLDGVDGVVIQPLFGAMPFKAQQAAIRPLAGARKIVLATAIAETSLTIPDIRVVIDGGWSRRARFDPGSGMTRLVSERTSRAEADQRQGRAGRVARGRCYRLWTRGEHGARPAFPPAEIEVADLTSLALELADWGADAGDLPFLTPPPDGPLAEARALLADLGALDGDAITGHGRRLAALPLHPRLGHMLDRAGPAAAPLAALLSDRDPLRDAGVDLGRRLAAIERGDPRADRGALARLRTEAKRLTRLAGQGRIDAAAEQAALAFPDRIALRRPGDAPRWVMSGGRGTIMDAEDPLAGARLLVVTESDGRVPEARIRQAIEISEAALRDVLGDRITRQRTCAWSRRTGRVEAWNEERLGALALSRVRWHEAPEDVVVSAMLEGVRILGLHWRGAAARLRARVEMARAAGLDLPAMDDASLMDSLEVWLAPYLSGVTSAADWKSFDLLPALQARLDYGQGIALQEAVPARYTTPLGREVAIDYSGDHPEIEVRLQEMFGVTRHPEVAGRPLRVTLLSPAQRPVQTTMDLPGFWASSYDDVRKDMRGRYPKHPWPEDPTVADPTLRAKSRK